jgi:hypothetical protein
MDLQAEINQKEQELKILRDKQELEMKDNMLIVFGNKYTYAYSHSYYEVGDVYTIKPETVIKYDRIVDEDSIISCQLQFEGDVIDMSEKLSQWNSCSESSDPGSSIQWCRIKKGKFTIEFTYDLTILIPKRLFYKHYGGHKC